MWINSYSRASAPSTEKSASPFQTYVDYMTRLYEREIKDFFEVAKIKMAGTTKDGKGKFGKTLFCYK